MSRNRRKQKVSRNRRKLKVPKNRRKLKLKQKTTKKYTQCVKLHTVGKITHFVQNSREQHHTGYTCQESPSRSLRKNPLSQKFTLALLMQATNLRYAQAQLFPFSRRTIGTRQSRVCLVFFSSVQSAIEMPLQVRETTNFLIFLLEITTTIT